MNYIITGQTSTGKTSRAISIALKLGADIISVDSRHVYRELNIVTGKDTDNAPFTSVEQYSVSSKQSYQIGYYELSGGVKLWGCDIVLPNEFFSAHDYIVVVSKIVRKHIKTHTPLVFVGGTYLYLSALEGKLSAKVPPDWKLRKELEAFTITELQEKLSTMNAMVFEQMNPSDRLNPRRLVRKIELLSQNGEAHPLALPTSNSNTSTVEFSNFEGYKHKNHDTCMERIAARVQQRIRDGAVNETQHLLDTYPIDSPGLNALGYQQLAAYIHGTCSLDDAITRWIQAEVSYAKRQLTFMKRDERFTWYTV